MSQSHLRVRFLGGYFPVANGMLCVSSNARLYKERFRFILVMLLDAGCIVLVYFLCASAGQYGVALRCV